MDITSRKNERVAHFKKLAASSGYRRERGEYLCDSPKLLDEAVKHGAEIREVMYTDGVRGDLPEVARAYRVTREVMEAVSPMRTPQGVVFTVAMGDSAPCRDMAGALIIENLQDPGNVGTILRTANAFGVPAVLLAGDCADIYNPKTVRASMGAVFRQKVTSLSYEDLAVMAERTPLYGAALREDAVDIRSADLTSAAVAIGNEGSGLSDRLLSLCRGTVIIPMRRECESLNAAAAAAVVMWEMSGRGL